MADSSQDSSSVVLDLIRKGKSLFITGKAGTGKTTLLQKIYIEEKHRRTVAIVAPTGVAAKQAGGVTIHSLLRLPLTPYMPGMKNPKLHAVRSQEDIKAIKAIDMLIIDEISMVRCDLMDAMDDVLRYYRGNNKPFGGVQVVMFGDLYQLMPVIKDDEWESLNKHYKSPYFFSSDAFVGLDCQVLELAHIYRQQDSDFINLLNNVRDGKLFPQDKKDLETRYQKNFIPKDDEGYIRLTTHNWMARKYNQDKLDSLSTKEYEFKAYIEGFFPKQEFPTNYVLTLKKGARVMFLRNDSDRKFVNGTLGTVIGFGDWHIEVKTDDGQIVDVTRQKWDFEKYKFNKQTKTLEIEHCGSFTQYPLRLAWCVTVHKSQGLTFDKVVVDVGRAFTYGQVYVALSRCRYFHGIVLVSEIKEKNIKSDPVVEKFLHDTSKIVLGKPNDETMQQSPTQGMTDSMKRTYWVVKEGGDAKEIIRRCRDEKPEVVYAHMAKLIQMGLADISGLLPNDTIKEIRSVACMFGKEANLKEIKSRLYTDYSYGEINMVKASLQDADYTAAPAPDQSVAVLKPQPAPPIPTQPTSTETTPQPTAPLKKDVNQPIKEIAPSEPKREQLVAQHKLPHEHKRWKIREEDKLKHYFQKGKDFKWLVNEIGRTEVAITTKLQQMKLIKWDTESGKYIKL